MCMHVQAAIRHDEKLAEVVLRAAASEREAEASWTAAKQQQARHISELETTRTGLEQRSLALAQNLAAKQV